MDGDKYSFKTYVVSLKDGSVKEEKVNYIIENSMPYNKDGSKIKYSVLAIDTINEDKSVGVYKE